MPNRDANPITALSSYWDALVHGSATAKLEDTEMAETVQRLDTHRTQLAPAAARARARAQFGLAETSQHSATLFPPGESTAPRLALPSSWRRDIDPRWFALAAGLLILLGVAAAAWTLGSRNEVGDPNTVPAVVPVAQSSPAAAQATPNGFVPTLPADAPVDFLWSVGSAGETPFLAPRDVEIAPDGNLWVFDADQHAVAVFSPEGEFIELWGGEGSGEGQFQNLEGENDYGGAAFDADGNYYVADSGNFRVQKFDANYQFLLEWGEEGEGDGQFEAASDVAIDSTGDVFVLDSIRSIVQIFDSEGTYLSSFPVVTASGTPVRTPNRLAIDGEDRVWITNIWQARIFSYARDGELLASIFSTASDLATGPHSIVVDKFGRLLVGDRDFHQVQLLDTTGTQLTQWGHGEVLTAVFPAALTGVTVDDEGNVYVINGDPGDQNHNLYKFKLKPEFWPEE